MSLTINTNINSLVAQNNLNTNQASLATAMQRLSSGLRINSAKDDAAGLSIAERMTSQINGSNQAARNANDGISLAQTAEGAMSQISANLQRMRELAVQSANGTNSASDRAALDNEVQALSQEIDRVAQSASFNGVNLLDGSFTAQKFQVGANGTANDSITVNSIASARTTVLGGVGTTYAATTTGTATAAALMAGDLTLNGVQVGTSTLGNAPGQSTASAYSIANAINNVSYNSGVTALANPAIVTGSSATAYGVGTGAIAANTFSVNGLNVGAISGGGSAAGQGANVAAAINALSAQTGVTAAADAASGALTLTAIDGRDINIAINGSGTLTTSAASQSTFLTQTGLLIGNVGAQAYNAVGGTVVAAGALNGATVPAWSAAGGTIAANTITAAGVAVGAVSLTSAVYAGPTPVSAALISATPVLTVSAGMTAGSTYNFTASGTGVVAAGAFSIVATGNATTDAQAIKTQFNALGNTTTLTGAANALTATDATTTLTFGLTLNSVRSAAQVAAGVTSGQAAVAVDAATATANLAQLSVSSGTLGKQSSGGVAYNGQQLATAIQTALTTAGSASTVSANVTTGVITAVGAAGIQFGLGGTADSVATGATNLAAAVAATGIAGANLGTQAVGGGVANHGTVTLSSTNPSGIIWGGAAAASAGFATSGTKAATVVSSVSSIASLNVLTSANATAALTAIDGALTTINASRAALGAYQNRFTSVVASLQTTAQNLTASRSRIQDADFAAETATLSRAQILQQAGTAMVAQANSLPQSVLQLLK